MAGPPTIYLDNNATTRPDPRVVELMSRLWRDGFANPGSRHAAGRRARQVLEQSRESMAAILGAESDEVIFTSGGTESNNMALLGCAQGPPGTIALTAGEHPAVMETCRFLEGKGWKLQILPVDEEGLLQRPEGAASLHPLGRGGRGGGSPDANALPADRPVSTAFLSTDVRLVTVILAHNETGVIQDVGELAEECRSRRIPFHVDAVQAVGKIPVNFHQLGVTSLALGAHKFHGPRGVGALLLRRGAGLASTSFGGHQESGRRPGTEVVPLIAGMALALELSHGEQDHRQLQSRKLRDRLHQGLSELCPPVILNGSPERRLPNTVNLAFPGVDGEALLVALDLAGIACSLGSTCASGSAEPAPALIAMNRPPDVLRSSVRFSLGCENTDDEIERAVQVIASTVNRLRQNP